MCERQAIGNRRKGKDTEYDNQSNKEMLRNISTFLYNQNIHLATGSEINDNHDQQNEICLMTEMPPRNLMN